MLLGLLLFQGPILSHAQRTPVANAVKLPDSLVFVGANPTNASITFNPIEQKYYSLRLGNSTYPMETWDITGGLSIWQDVAGLDTRGIWWNPLTRQVERNCLGNIGWGPIDLDATGNAVSTTTLFFTGMMQPNTQSVGTLDWRTNTVIFYNAGSLYVYARNTGALTTTIPLTGTSLATVNSNSVIYTGEVGYEVGLLDYTNKRVLLFDRATGVYTGMSQLPADATTASGYRFGYANARVWLFTSAQRKWNAYCIWNQLCLWDLLPVELLHAEAICEGEQATLRWSTASEHNSSHFIVERSADLVDWQEAGNIPAAGNSQQTTAYAWRDEAPLPATLTYYRLRQIDLDGSEEVLAILPLHACNDAGTALVTLPNPTTGSVLVRLHTPATADGTVQVDVLSPDGRVALREQGAIANGTLAHELDMGHLAAGTYTLVARDAQGTVLGTARVVRE